MKQKTVILGFLLALSLILSYVESLLPLAIGIPGIKLGLPNLVVVLLLYLYGGREAFAVNLLRILISGLLFGNLSAILYAFTGAACSFIAMFLLKKAGRFSMIGVSIGGGVFHCRFRRGNFCTGVLSAVSVDCRSCHRIFHRPYRQPRAAITQQNSKEWRNHINVRLFKRYDRRDYGR